MDLSEALYAARDGATIRDDSGTMKQGWSVKFVPDSGPDNLAKPAQQQAGKFFYIRPTGEDAHQLFFKTEHRASVAWNIVKPPPKKAEPKAEIEPTT
jgi:hypothetical protein